MINLEEKFGLKGWDKMFVLEYVKWESFLQRYIKIHGVVLTVLL